MVDYGKRLRIRRVHPIKTNKDWWNLIKRTAVSKVMIGLGIVSIPLGLLASILTDNK